MCVKSKMKQIFNMISEEHFASYLTGLIEDDGHINAKQIIIIFNGAIKVGAQKFSAVLGGRVTEGKTTYSWRYVLASKHRIRYVLKITSNAWVGPFKAESIKKHGCLRLERYDLTLQQKTLTLNNFWLAGWTRMGVLN